MRLRKAIARLLGALYLLLGAVSLLGLLIPDVREQIISLGAVLFRYTGFVVVGTGLVMLRKWSAYVLVFVLLTNFILIYAIYGGQTMELDGYLALLPFVGPIITAAMYYYLWPALQPQVSRDVIDDA